MNSSAQSEHQTDSNLAGTRRAAPLQQATLGLNDNPRLYGTDATCEKQRPLPRKIWDHQWLQLRRCLVGSPRCRVEALQRFQFPQPAVCGGDIWSEKYPEHLWLENNPGLCSERVGGSANTLRSLTYLVGGSSCL